MRNPALKEENVKEIDSPYVTDRKKAILFANLFSICQFMTAVWTRLAIKEK